MIIKLGEAININQADVKTAEDLLTDPEISERFTKMAQELKRIAPKADDFIYFAAIMMHAAEASLYDDGGKLKKTATGEDVIGYWEQNGESWRWKTNEPSIKPYKNCFIPGTQISMADGSVKNIEDVEPGDFVITHTGKSQKVLRKFITPHNDVVLKLKIKNNQELICTKNHPLFSVKFDKETDKGLKSLTSRKKIDESFRTQFDFVPAEKLKIGNLLTSPVVSSTIDSNLNVNRARLLGIFAAEGSYSKKYDKRQGLKFTIGINEEKQAELIQKTFLEEFPECSVLINKEPSRSIIEITATGYAIADYFYYHIGEYSHLKKLSKELVFSNNDIKKAFLAGWLDGDGCITDYNKLIGITTSPHLANQIRLMLNSMRIGNSLRKVKSNGKRKILNNKEYETRDSFRLELYGDAYKKLDFDKNTIKYNFGTFNHKILSNFDGNYCLHYISDINEENYNGDVYNIEVENDNSYVANGVIVSNCNGDIFPEQELIKAHKNWVGKPLCLDHKSSSVEMTRGVIVDTYYDFQNKRVVALCALDKKNYPDLARKVKTGYAASVSMGTAVATAICYDCGNVAKTEHDFCNCMRTRSCYGEINVGLNPIELSIVVNGADPKAKIKHIYAAANSISQYLASKEEDFIKNGNDSNLGENLDKIIKNLELLKEEIKSLEMKSDEKEIKSDESKQKTEDSNNNKDYNQDDKESLETTASTNHNNGEILSKLSELSERVNKLSSMYNEEKTDMTTKQAYFQGGGGVNEPTPGKPKYEKEDNESIRMQDKQMVGQMNTGPVDGMHPGYESFGETEEARKKRLQRLAAEKEERSMRRLAALEKAKKAYFQGGGGVNEPTPGKPKYEKEDNESIRESEDKQMVGQAPFPGVGAVDGLHPSPASVDIKDELKRKQMLLRASKMSAKFHKAANADGTDNIENSRWNVFADKKLILTATVKDIAGKQADVLYDTIATADFGRKLMEKIRSNGVDKVSGEFAKSAQAVPQMPDVPAMPEAPAMPEMPKSEMKDVTDEGGTGDPAEQIPELLDKGENIIADLRKGFDTLTNKSGNELGEIDNMAKNDAIPPAMASKRQLQLKLAKGLAIGFKKAETDLAKNIKELKLAQNILKQKSQVKSVNKEYLKDIVQAGIDETKQNLNEGYKLLTAFVNYSYGIDKFIKEAKEMNRLKKVAQTKGAGDPLEGMGDDYDWSKDIEQAHKTLEQHPEWGTTPVKPGDVSVPKTPAAPIMGTPPSKKTIEQLTEDRGDRSGLENMLKENTKALSGQSFSGPASKVPAASNMSVSPDAGKPDAVSTGDSNNLKMMPDGSMEGSPKEVGEAMKAKEATFDMTTKEGRALWRAKLAEKGLVYSDILNKAHKPNTVLKFDSKPSGDLAKVETTIETQKVLMDIMHAEPKVKKAAENIQELVLTGKINPNTDFPKLIANGLDKDAVSYWKQFWGQAKDGGSEFATELTKDISNKKQAQANEDHQVKLARAYDLAYEMADAGYFDKSVPGAVKDHVKEIMAFNDEAYNSMKRVIEKYKMNVKTASAMQNMPQVGVMNLPALPNKFDTMIDEYSSFFNKKRY